jgi:16S rRNA (cytidine1402-2'-O)-methyltransferase
MAGLLSLVSTHIGNPGDITLRAIDTIRTCDILLVEERKPANRLLAHLGIKKEYILFNEHTDRELVFEILTELHSGKHVALISDAGTPLLADPGENLVKKALTESIRVTTLPGSSSVLPALLLSGFRTAPFTFIGFIPKEKSQRLEVLKMYSSRNETLILFETPYRLSQVVSEIKISFGAGRNIAVCTELTTEKEKVVRGKAGKVESYFKEHPFKGEYVIVIEGREQKSR